MEEQFCPFIHEITSCPHSPHLARPTQQTQSDIYVITLNYIFGSVVQSLTGTDSFVFLSEWMYRFTSQHWIPLSTQIYTLHGSRLWETADRKGKFVNRGFGTHTKHSKRELFTDCLIPPKSLISPFLFCISYPSSDCLVWLYFLQCLQFILLLHLFWIILDSGYSG